MAGRSPEPQGLRRSQRPAGIAQEITVVIISQGFCGKRQVLHRIIQSQIRGRPSRRFLSGHDGFIQVRSGGGGRGDVGHLVFKIGAVVGGLVAAERGIGGVHHVPVDPDFETGTAGAAKVEEGFAVVIHRVRHPGVLVQGIDGITGGLQGGVGAGGIDAGRAGGGGQGGAAGFLDGAAVADVIVGVKRASGCLDFSAGGGGDAGPELFPGGGDFATGIVTVFPATTGYGGCGARRRSLTL